jgi:DNA-binding response OmpR family regulator
MKIAIIIEDSSIKSKLKTLLEGTDWEADFFKNSVDFGTANISKYDIIVSDISIKPVNGRQILQSIRLKTNAELYLMGNGSFSETDINNDHIKGLIDKFNVNDFLDKIDYVKIKKRLQKSATEADLSIDTV